MSITFTPAKGTVVTYVYYDDAATAPDHNNGVIRFEHTEPSCNTHSSNGIDIIKALGLRADYCGHIPVVKLTECMRRLRHEWPVELIRYQDSLMQVMSCAIYHACEVHWA